MGDRLAVSCHLSVIALPLPFMNSPLSGMDYYFPQKKGWEWKLLTNQNLINTQKYLIGGRKEMKYDGGRLPIDDLVTQISYRDH